MRSLCAHLSAYEVKIMELFTYKIIFEHLLIIMFFIDISSKY